MKYRSNFKIGAQLTGLVFSLIPYILVAPISTAFAETLFLERIHFKNAPSKLTHNQLSKFFQFYQKLFEIGYRLGSVVDTLLCGIAQPLFFLSEKLFSKSSTENFVRSVADRAHAINEKFEKALSSSLSFYLPALISIGALITAPLLGIGLIATYSLCKLYPSVISWGFKNSSRLKEPSIQKKEIHDVNIDLLCFPGKYPKDNLLSKSEEIIETIKDDYHSDYAILNLPKIGEKAGRSAPEKSDAERKAYKIGEAYGRGIIDALNKDEPHKKEKFLYKEGQKDLFPKIIQKRKSSQKSKDPTTFSLHSYKEDIKNPPKYKIALRRSKVFPST